jgi:hypothetical protein
MPELPAALAGIVITIGIAAVLAGAAGDRVKISNNELSVNGTPARAVTAFVGLLLVGWSAWSLRERPFEVEKVGGTRLEVLNTDPSHCAARLQLAVLVHFHRAPGTVRYELRLGKGIPVKVFSQKLQHTGSGTDVLGPEQVSVPASHRQDFLQPEVWIDAPNLIGPRKVRLFRPTYLQEPAEGAPPNCGLRTD